MIRFAFLMILTASTYVIQVVLFALAMIVVVVLSDPFSPSSDPDFWVILHPVKGYEFHKGWTTNLMNWIKKEIQ